MGPSRYPPEKKIGRRAPPPSNPDARAKHRAMREVERRLESRRNRHGVDGTHTTARELYARMNKLRNQIAELS